MIRGEGRVLAAPDIPHAEFEMGKVAILYTTLETAIGNYAHLPDQNDYQTALLPDIDTFQNVNVSLQREYLVCSSAPWHIDGSSQEAAG